MIDIEDSSALVRETLDELQATYPRDHSVRFYQANAADREAVNDLVDADDRATGLSGFDFIIDDGSHMYNDVSAALDTLFSRLNPGGVYFIEDLNAGAEQLSGCVRR